MPRQPVNLNSGQLTQSLSVKQDVEAEYLVFYNHNPVPVYVRTGSPEIPTELNYDYVIPPNMDISVPVSGREFGLRLGNVGVNVSLIQSGTVVEALWNEPPPSFGGVPVNMASLSTSDLTNGFVSYSGASYIAVNGWDLTLWGGAIIHVQPLAGQGIVAIEISDDRSVWRPFATYAIWPGVPLTINQPRVARYFRVSTNVSGIAGEPTITGVVSVRATLTEIVEANFSPGGTPIVTTMNIPALGNLFKTFITVGMKAVVARWNITSGNRGELVWYTGPGPTGPWSLVAFREQTVAGFYNSVFRSIGNLDNFLQVWCLDTVGGGINSTLALSVQQEPDLSSMLQNVFSALGDVGQPVNTNQSIYHELDKLRISNDAIQTSNAGIQSVVAAYQPYLVNLPTMSVYESNLPTMVSYESNLPGIKGDTGNLPGIKSDTASLPTISSTLSTMSNRANVQSGIASVTVGILAPGGIYHSPVMFNPGTVIVAMAWSVQLNVHAGAYSQILIGVSDGITVQRWIGQFIIPNTNLGAAPFLLTGGSGTVVYGSERAGGLILTTSETHSCFFSSAIAGTGGATFTMA